MATLSDRLKELRSEKRLTQLEVAQEIGVSHAAYQKYEYAEISPRKDKIHKLADFFKVSVEYLRGETDDRGDGIEIHAHRDPSTRGMQVSDAIDIVDKLERLVKLKDAGAITEEEFMLFKRKLLK